MKVNENKIDRVARIVVGAAVLTLAFWGPQTAWGYLGLIPLLTGIAGYCPLYSVFGFSTCPLSRS